MTRDEIYDHLAQVYLGKRKQQVDEKQKSRFNAWIWINVLITVLIFASSFYGLTAFLTTKEAVLKQQIAFPLHNGLININFNFEDEFLPTKSFSINVSDVDVSEYQNIRFSIRAKEEGNPGVVKLVIKNKRNETSSFYIEKITSNWQEFNIPLNAFYQITDWHSVSEISFVLESWNVDNRKGVILVDELNFFGVHNGNT
ncbi:MAG: hypothetical protein KC713_05995 [Candidatus Omnitrophica bacterium]|nr:hypothetical protein [Candidatus Omnitrophota bacterium]